MGMFDSFYFKKGILPDNKESEETEFQTKDLECNLDRYEVDENGFVTKYTFCDTYKYIKSSDIINCNIEVYSYNFESEITRKQEYELVIKNNRLILVNKVYEEGYNDQLELEMKVNDKLIKEELPKDFPIDNYKYKRTSTLTELFKAHEEELESVIVQHTELEAKYYDLQRKVQELQGVIDGLCDDEPYQFSTYCSGLIYNYDQEVKKLEAQLFNSNEHYQQLLINYTEMTDFLAESLHTDSSTAFDLFKHWLTDK